MPGKNWTSRDDIALEIFIAWLPSQLNGKDLDKLPESVARANMEHAFKIADLFLSVQRAVPS